MRLGLLAAVLFISTWGVEASATEIDVTSRAAAVTVFPRGAEVRRIGKVHITKGEHKLVFGDLPSQAIIASIRVEGKSTGGLEIGSVDGRRVFVARNEGEVANSERRRLETEIERLSDELANHQATIAAKDIQKKFVENLAALPVRPPPQAPAAPGAVTGENWTAIFDLIGGRLADLQRVVQETKLKMRDIERRITDLKKKLASLAPGRIQRTEVKVSVISSQDLDAELVVTYQVGSAAWTPTYSARLESGSRSLPAKLTLTRRALVQQSTDEVWKDVTLELSTTRPAARSSAPNLRTLTVDISPPPPSPLAQESTLRRREYRSATGRAAKSADAPAAAPAAPVMKAATEQTAVAAEGTFQAVFAVPGRLTIANTGDVTRVKISDITLEPALMVRSVPKRDRQTYLYAKIKLPKGAPYLPGRIELFRDQTFAGYGHLPQLAPGEKHEVGFGADDLVRVRYDVTDQRTGETGIISSSRTDQRRYKIAIKNLHERPIAYSILDQMPVPADDKIKVELQGATAPTRKDVKGQRGVLEWSGKLSAEEEKVIDFGYVVSWPSDVKVYYR